MTDLKAKYFTMLDNLKNKQEQKYNDKILLIDGFNLFIRNCRCNFSLNDDGIHVGGLIGSIMSIAAAVRLIKPTRVILIFDGENGSHRRKKIFPGYKSGRTSHHEIKDNQEQSVHDAEMLQVQRLIDYLDYLPLSFLSVNNIEADDSIAYIVSDIYNKPENNIIILSSDKDYLQLVDDRVTVYNAIKKRFYTPESVLEDYEIPAHNFLLYRMLDGDASDNVPGITGIGMKTLKKELPEIFTEKQVNLDNLFEIISTKDGKSKVTRRIRDNKEQLKMNYTLMQLKGVDIPNVAKLEIARGVHNEPPKLQVRKILKLLYDDKISLKINDPTDWLLKSFGYLDAINKE